MKINPDYKGHYQVVYVDPPWMYNSGGARSGRFAPLDYAVMTANELKDMPVSELAAKDAAVFMWTTSAFLQEAIALGEEWGFKYVRVDRVWAKVKDSGQRHGVCGPWGMTDVEFLLLFVRGKMCSHQSVRNQYSMAWQEPYPGKHSGKPSAFRDSVRNRFEDMPRIELFSRSSEEDWDHWGIDAPEATPVFIVELDAEDLL